MADQDSIKREIIRLTKERGLEKTICPSEAAKACDSENWRSLMDDVINVAEELQRQGIIAIEQKGREVSLGKTTGPIRLRIKRDRG